MRFKFIRENIKNKIHKLAPGICEYVLARTAFFDKVFKDALNNKIPQIVLLGAGYDTRPYRFANLGITGSDLTNYLKLLVKRLKNGQYYCLEAPF